MHGYRPHSRAASQIATAVLCLLLGLPLLGYTAQQAVAASVELAPESLRLEVGATATLKATVRDAAGNPLRQGAAHGDFQILPRFASESSFFCRT